MSEHQDEESAIKMEQVRKDNRECHNLLRHWQKFCARLAKRLGVSALDEDVEKAVEQVQGERDQLREELEYSIVYHKPHCPCKRCP